MTANNRKAVFSAAQNHLILIGSTWMKFAVTSWSVSSSSIIERHQIFVKCYPVGGKKKKVCNYSRLICVEVSNEIIRDGQVSMWKSTVKWSSPREPGKWHLRTTVRLHFRKLRELIRFYAIFSSHYSLTIFTRTN